MPAGNTFQRGYQCRECDAPLPDEVACNVCEGLGLRECSKCGEITDVGLDGY